MPKNFYIVLQDGKPRIEQLTAEEAQNHSAAIIGPFDTLETAEAEIKKRFPPMQWDRF